MVVLPFTGTRTGWTTGTNRNLMKFNKGKCEVLHLVRNNSMHHYTLGADQLESSFAKKDLGVLLDKKLNMSNRRTLAEKKGQQLPGLQQVEHCQQVKGGDPSLLSTGEDTTRVLCPVLALDFPLQDTDLLSKSSTGTWRRLRSIFV
ncbi:hypothetical protein llap_6081 [Limosa lapponica baueri]|uniref:Rna-directed dna polymerase from mobile element jockey-like n=1 Tax=Limosa lapponica baueri TaxID=1758121 RepID=A0A2I0UCB6_LIMLA|nr:hypothetical protein llap_6081 [Limosa lapponica baueri]